MAINRVEIKDFLAFHGDFACDFCDGVNVIIGGNGTGKTTLLKVLYSSSHRGYFGSYFGASIGNTESKFYASVASSSIVLFSSNGSIAIENGTDDFSQMPEYKTFIKDMTFVYIPEKDILEHAIGLLPFIEQKQTGFSRIYKDVLVNAQDIPTQQQSKTQKKVRQMISNTTGGDVYWDKSDGSFYTLRTDNSRIPFANEASGYKKLGYLGLLVASGQLEEGSVLFWDEPENSLNPELMPVLVEILFELQRNGVQIFIATHSYTLARYFDVNSDKKNNKIMFYNLTKESDGRITAVSSSECRKLSKNILDEADEELYKVVVRNAMVAQDNG